MCVGFLIIFIKLTLHDQSIVVGWSIKASIHGNGSNNQQQTTPYATPSISWKVNPIVKLILIKFEAIRDKHTQTKPNQTKIDAWTTRQQAG